jgi:hypothetical protein
MAARLAVAWAGISLLLLVAFPAGAAVNAAAPDLTLGGLLQSRLVLQKDQGSSFTDSRFFLNGLATTGTNTKVGFLLTNFTSKRHDSAANDGGGVLKAYVQNTKGAYTCRLGMDVVPFGLENPTADWLLPTLERSAVVDDLVSEDWGYDTGLFVDKAADKSGVAMQFALTNGEGLNRKGVTENGDDNNGKCLTARVTKAVKTSTMGASFQYDDGGDWLLAGADYQGTVGDLAVKAEALCVDDWGWHGTGFYVTGISDKAILTNWKPYARLQWYDPDTDESSDEFTGFTVGIAKQTGALTKETLEINNGQLKSGIEPSSSPSCGGQTWEAAYQWQGKF